MLEHADFTETVRKIIKDAYATCENYERKKAELCLKSVLASLELPPEKREQAIKTTFDILFFK